MTDNLYQCKNCIYHYTYNGRDMCKQVGDDFYLQWKIEDCPYHTTITKATAISDEIYRLRAENAALRERLEKTEHRAKGVERALKKFAENISCEDCPFFSDCASSEKMKDSVHSNYCFAEYLRQAEKELVEEGKDD